MTLRILVPFGIFRSLEKVVRIVAETRGGSMGILPNRLDFATALEPGILVCETAGHDEIYFAVDEGILVKTGPDVYLSSRNAIGDAALGQLKQAIDKDIRNLDFQERTIRSVLAKLESEFMRRLEKFKIS